MTHPTIATVEQDGLDPVVSMVSTLLLAMMTEPQYCMNSKLLLLCARHGSGFFLSTLVLRAGQQNYFLSVVVVTTKLDIFLS